jgi:hypothetical protein
MQKLTLEVIKQLNNLGGGFPPAPTGPGNAPENDEQWILGDWLAEIRLRPGVTAVGDLPATGNTTSDVRFVFNAQTFYFWSGAAWLPIAGGGGGGGITNPQITGQVTAGLLPGEVCFTSAANTWSRAQSDGTLSQATAIGIYEGVAGTISLSGSPIASLRCTTAGGLPAVNDKLYLARAADDGGTGAGKVTATPPSPAPGGSVHLTVIGTCVDNANYAGVKTVKAILEPAYPVILFG